MEDRVVTLNAFLALTWKPVSNSNSLSSEQLNDNNQRCLQQALLLDNMNHAGLDDSIAEHHDIARLEKKIDLMFTLLSNVISNQQQDNPHTDCIISYQAIQWQDSRLNSIHKQDLLEVSVNIHPLTINPVILRGSVIQLDDNSVTVQYSGNGASWEDLLEKYIFL